MFEQGQSFINLFNRWIALTHALQKATACPQWECFHTQIGLERDEDEDDDNADDDTDDDADDEDDDADDGHGGGKNVCSV